MTSQYKTWRISENFTPEQEKEIVNHVHGISKDVTKLRSYTRDAVNKISNIRYLILLFIVLLLILIILHLVYKSEKRLNKIGY